MSTVTIAVLTYCIFGAIFIVASTIENAISTVEDESLSDAMKTDFTEYKKQMFNKKGVCYKIMAYVFSPFTLTITFIVVIAMIIALPFRRRR